MQTHTHNGTHGICIKTACEILKLSNIWKDKQMLQRNKYNVSFKTSYKETVTAFFSFCGSIQSNRNKRISHFSNYLNIEQPSNNVSTSHYA